MTIIKSYQGKDAMTGESIYTTHTMPEPKEENVPINERDRRYLKQFADDCAKYGSD